MTQPKLKATLTVETPDHLFVLNTVKRYIADIIVTHPDAVWKIEIKMEEEAKTSG